ncbi:DUF255 domain-containing protein [Hydrogenimonas urashimensis]|uniref:DUF255 domain-containing protein n=1 Tax=Hydrogenimonas urashimensis TaxID=2740515 RepID=UPI0019158BE1|nr:DUF255 domain-containing protein [Hydrogenimonas urashimensis]
MLFAIQVVVAAERVHWYGRFDAALEVSQRTKKPMLVLLVTKECDACRHLLVKTFGDSQIAHLVNENAIAVIVTKENEDYPIELLYSTRFPTLFLLSPEENFMMEPLRGEVDKALLRRILEEKFSNER